MASEMMAPSKEGRSPWRRVFALGVLAAAAAGCRPPTMFVPAVQVQVAAQPAEVHPGDTVRTAVTVSNPRPDTVLLEFGMECRVSFAVLDQTDRAVSSEPHCLFPAGGRLVLAPGGTWRVSGAWRAVRRTGEPLPPGTYAIAAGLGDHHATVRGKREYKAGAGAERVPVRVLPPRS